MFGLTRVGMCETCRGDVVVPNFSEKPTAPFCIHGPHDESDVTLEEAREVADATFSDDDEEKLAMRLSANVGGYQTALFDKDKAAAKAFLANVMAIGGMLLKRTEP